MTRNPPREISTPSPEKTVPIQRERELHRSYEKNQAMDVPFSRRVERKFNERERELEAQRGKRAEIIEKTIMKNPAIAPEKQANDTQNLHFSDKPSFEAEFQKREPEKGEAFVDRVEGFHDPRDNQAFVKETGDTFLTGVHEKLHQKSMGDLPTRFNEGLTEHLARQEAGEAARLKNISSRGFETPKPLSDYDKEVALIGQLEAVIGKEPLARAYFGGDTAYLREHVDSAIKKGSFQKITDLMEKGDYDTAAQIIAGYNRR